jgi:hypothetical protein
MNKINLKKIFIASLFVIFFSLTPLNYILAVDEPVIVNPDDVKPKGNNTGDMTSYEPLAKLPGMPSVIDPGIEDGAAGSFTLPQYIRTLIRIAIGIIGILSVLMIIIAGVQYMGSNIITEKEDAKNRLFGAVGGLILAVSSVMLLRTINPQLVEIRIGTDNLGNKAIDVNYVPLPKDLEGDSGSSSYSGLKNFPEGIYCPKKKSSNNSEINKIALSFKNRTTYRLGGGHSQNQPPFNDDSKMCNDGKTPCKSFCPEGTVCLDCSAFVNQILECAGLERYSGRTLEMTKNTKSEKIKSGQLTKTQANGIDLKPGDLIFWNNNGDGHVVIYIGGGKTAESFGGDKGRQKGSSIAIQDADHYKNRGQLYIYRVK